MCSLCESEKWKSVCTEKDLIYRSLGDSKIDLCISSQGKYFLRDMDGHTFTIHRCITCGRKLY